MANVITKQQAIKALIKLGCSNVEPRGKFLVWITTPEGHRALADPRDLLAELNAELNASK